MAAHGFAALFVLNFSKALETLLVYILGGTLLSLSVVMAKIKRCKGERPDTILGKTAKQNAGEQTDVFGFISELAIFLAYGFQVWDYATITRYGLLV